MTEPRTVILLDSYHSVAFAPAAAEYPSNVSLAQQPPSIPLWATMVNGTLQFCRLAWDLGSPARAPISVTVANDQPAILNQWEGMEQQQLHTVASGFVNNQPRYNESINETRLSTALDLAIEHTIAPRSSKQHRYRLIFVILCKGADEDGFKARHGSEQVTFDLRAMMCRSFHALKHRCQIHIDVLRVWPSSTSIPQDKPLTKIKTDEITMSIYNIPNGQSDLTRAMVHLAQIYYNINTLCICRIPMKNTADTAEGSQSPSTQDVHFYYACGNTHLINQAEPTKNKRLYEPAYLENRTLRLTYLKRSKRPPAETEWTRCMHSISPVQTSHPPTNAFIDMMYKGSTCYLTTSEVKIESPTVKNWTHMLGQYQGTVFLYCLDNKLEADFATMRANAMEMMEVKVENDHSSNLKSIYIPKNKQEFDAMIRSCTFDDLDHAFNAAETGQSPLVKYSPLKYAHFISMTKLLHSPSVGASDSKTMKYLERATRWHACLRDGSGAVSDPNDKRSISELATDVLNTDSECAGFGGFPGLGYDPLLVLKEYMLLDNVYVEQATKFINTLVSELHSVLIGSKLPPYILKSHQYQAPLLAKKLLVALYLIGKRFQHDSPTHMMVCQTILTVLRDMAMASTTDNNSEFDVAKTEPENAMDMAWHQATRIEKMTQREKEDLVHDVGPESKRIKTEGPALFTNQLPIQPRAAGREAKSGINPNFRGRRARSGAGGPAPPKYPNPAIMVPYLESTPPTVGSKRAEEEEEKKRLGPTNSLLHMYWTAQNLQKEGLRDEDDESFIRTESVYRNGSWKRVRREFDGRLPSL
ncbi:uncharacterized protein BYT42DRAFT_571129 [Radiomyces spectabilis]|uniref:uncharacterized protein n=1 Tax=Radiomyces spectabilis TaxID=64574 RepID=UPI00221F36C2|nr:uncharacterized protein BYT42DRAFT_571129 [Radiomyces spectabilis]KAI8377655.1 hypothetical protein BYT42DRAFT_571129 [Radiomyces spectabilis]